MDILSILIPQIHEHEISFCLCGNISEPGGHYAMWNRPDTEKQIVK